MQDGLGSDTCQCAVGNGDKLTNGWKDENKVTGGWIYHPLRAEKQSTAACLGHSQGAQLLQLFSHTITISLSV